MTWQGRGEKVNVSMASDWFDGMIEALMRVEKSLKNMISAHPDERCWQRDLEANLDLRDKLIKYGQYFNTAEDDVKWMQAKLFRSTGEDLIWQLVLAVTLFVDAPEGVSYYDDFKKQHEAFVAEYEQKHSK